MTSPIAYWRHQKSVSQYLGQSGKVISWTVIHVSTDEFSDQAPYPVVLVELSAKVRLLLQLVDYEPHHLVSGQSIICVIRRSHTPDHSGIVSYCLKAKPDIS